MKDDVAKDPDYDVVIIGGGISGVYTAWRLIMADNINAPFLKRSKDKQLRIALFEGSDRIGGRLLSARAPGFPHMNCEIGGMRYVSSQKLVSALIENELKLPRHEQDVAEPINIIYTRGHRLRSYQLSDPDVLPYNLSEEESE